MPSLSVRISASQTPLTTAHLAKTMELLALTTTELEAAVAQELASNPALELVDERRCPGCGRPLRRLPCPKCAQADGDQPIVYLTPRTSGLSFNALGDDHPETQIAQPERLAEHLLRQIGPELAPEERQVAAYLVASLDDHGMLSEAPLESAHYLHVPVSTVERILGLLQHADPPGIAARDVRESLLVQLDHLAEHADGESAPDAALLSLARAVMVGCWPALGKRDYARIAATLHVTQAAAETAAAFIHHNLTPFPAAAFRQPGRGTALASGEAYYHPDATITRNPHRSDGPLVVELQTPTAGWLRVSPDIKAILSECPPEERPDWEAYVEQAALTVKCLQQRHNTMRRLMSAIVAKQRDFILGGDADLRPTTRVQIARQLGVHESTISRAVAHKTVALPDGRIVPLSKFFDRSLSVRNRVKLIIQSETKPLTDDEISRRLAKQGYKVARRTVAKYRTMLGILPASVRGRRLPVTARGPQAQVAR